MKKNIIVTCVVSGGPLSESISFKAEIIAATELFTIKTQSKFAKAIAGFKEWEKGFFTLEGFDAYNFNFE